MEKKNKNEELQSRRDFFRNAAKKALPILGAVVLTSIPFGKSNASETPQCYCTSCVGGCDGSCYSTCIGSCQYSCNTTCSNTCMGSCLASCAGTCSGSCAGMSMF